MARMYDRIWTSKVDSLIFHENHYSMSSFEEKKDYMRSVIESINNSEVIVIDNVHKYFQDKYDVGTKPKYDDFPCIVPPFRKTFMEYSNINGSLYHSKTIKSVACFFKTFSREEIEKSREEPAYEAFILAFPDLDTSLIHNVVSTNLIIEHTNKIVIDCYLGAYLVDKEGKLIKYPIAFTSHTDRGISHSDYSSFVVWNIAEFFLALSFLNCKNVTLKREGSPGKPRTERMRKKHGLRPLVRYHTLDIEPMKTILKNDGCVESNGLKKALHICRGHFARYTEEKPLFGHTVGMVWRPAHTRGKFVPKGLVMKDYNILTPSHNDAPIVPGAK